MNPVYSNQKRWVDSFGQESEFSEFYTLGSYYECRSDACLSLPRRENFYRNFLLRRGMGLHLYGFAYGFLSCSSEHSGVCKYHTEKASLLYGFAYGFLSCSSEHSGIRKYHTEKASLLYGFAYASLNQLAPETF
nr:hypothetical protein [Xenorhabdus bovienii]